mmetsp:Transcript_5447/g.18433  ORF Transcript_5447/g.18433 Transcript_5447/m.18433 type:complete len:200 (-) Transcript_5447:237-836(-)
MSTLSRPAHNHILLVRRDERGACRLARVLGAGEAGEGQRPHGGGILRDPGGASLLLLHRLLQQGQAGVLLAAPLALPLRNRGGGGVPPLLLLLFLLLLPHLLCQPLRVHILWLPLPLRHRLPLAALVQRVVPRPKGKGALEHLCVELAQHQVLPRVYRRREGGEVHPRPLPQLRVAHDLGQVARAGDHGGRGLGLQLLI